MSLSVIGASPGGPLVLLGAVDEGVSPVPAGPCEGTDSGLDAPTVVHTTTATSGGDLRLTRDVPADLCGRYLQALDVDTCRTAGARRVE